MSTGPVAGVGPRRRQAPRPTPRLLAMLAGSLAIVLASAPPGVARTQVGSTTAVGIESPHPYPDGDAGRPVVWRHTLRHPDATFLKLHLARLELGRGDRVRVLDARGRIVVEYAGPRADGARWAPAVPGDTAVVELRADAEDGGHGVTIDRYGHGAAPIRPTSICGTDAKEDVACYAGTPIETSSRAVGRMLFEDHGVFFACTGFLISAQDHLLTSEHCISSQRTVDSLEVTFDFQSASCGGGSTDPSPGFAGERLVTKSRELDMALVTLRDRPSAQHGFLPLSARAPVAGEALYLPQHPGGNDKKVSVLGCAVSTAPGAGRAFGHLCDTEPGSSGSPVLDLAHEVVGLHRLGGCAAEPGENGAVLMRAILPLLPPGETQLALTAASLRYGPAPNRGRLALRGIVRLGRSSAGTDPLTEPVTVTLADADGAFYSATVPPGAFRRVGRRLVFSDPTGTLAGGLRTLRLQPSGAVDLRISMVAAKLDLGRADREEVLVTLQIGDDRGTWFASFRRRPGGLVYP